MKKNNILFNLALLTVLSLSLALASCKPGTTTDADSQSDFSLALADTIIKQYNASRPEWDAALSTVGPVTILIKPDHIELQHIGENVFELMSYFILMGDKKHDLEGSFIERAEVIFLDRAILVNSLESRKTLHFYIETDSKPEYLKEIKGIKSYGGYGIGLRKITSGSQADQAPYCGCQSSTIPPANCKAGGVMNMTCATANEHGSCRVSCSGQTYACCDKGNTPPQ